MTFADFPNNEVAKKLLRTLALICQPYMERRKLNVTYLRELPVDSPKHGTNQTYVLGCTYVTEAIRIKLRNPKKPDEFLPPDMLLSIMCHELAHDECEGHSREFYALWQQAMDEMELDLGRKMKIRWHYCDGSVMTENMLRWTQWHADEIEERVKAMDIKPNVVTMNAAESWEWEHGWFRKNPPNLIGEVKTETVTDSKVVATK
ncbi:hypothetical protein EK21DRAFT_116351 [Setomelanomma holmii]|uniref:WLM domain-containing protein n=1 Tax=Setomelanomma holmii TaxID=210430 RepID=A0A9P4H253_9PLEO|nr:hypothetical protein EK21DRAFT_116351 [Setomelanomma holmii]